MTVTIDSLAPRYVQSELYNGPGNSGLFGRSIYNNFGLLGDEVEVAGQMLIKADPIRCRYYYWHHKADLTALWLLSNLDPSHAWVVRVAGD